MSSLGQKLRSIRKERNLTQHSLGRGIVSSSMISQIESDRIIPSADLLRKLAERLNVDTSYLLTDSLGAKELFSYHRAKGLLAAGLYVQAIACLKPLLARDTDEGHISEAELYFDAAVCYIHLERYDEAVEIYELALKAFLNHQDVHNAVYSYYYLGHLYFRLNTPKLARMYWQRAQALIENRPSLQHPFRFKVYLGLARAHSQLQEYHLAEQNYLQAEKLALQSESWLDVAEIYDNLSMNYVSNRSFQFPELYLERARAIHSAIYHQPGVLRTTLRWAVQQRRKGQLQKAEMELSTLIVKLRATPEQTPDWVFHAHVYLELAASQIELGMLQRAWHTLTLLDELPPELMDEGLQIQGLLLRVHLLILENELDQALHTLEQASRIANAQNNLAFFLVLRFLERQLYMRTNARARAVKTALDGARKILNARQGDVFEALKALNLPPTTARRIN